MTAADATRDRIFYAMWYAWEYLSQLDQHHPLYVASNTLRSEMMKCKGAARFKLEAETEAISGLQTALANPTNGEALATLGLDKIAAALWEANEAVKTVMDTRNVERGERAEGRADGGGEGDQGGGRRGRAVQAHCRPAREAQEGRPGARGVKREGRAPSRPFSQTNLSQSTARMGNNEKEKQNER